LAAFDCRVVSVQDHSTHHVLFGEVVGLRSKADDEALVYLNQALSYAGAVNPMP
jgi:cob(II)yrinic acid a,c-diamide reductase